MAPLVRVNIELINHVLILLIQVSGPGKKYTSSWQEKKKRCLLTLLLTPPSQLLKWVLEHMGDSPKKTSLQGVLSAGKAKVSFLPYDWSSNSTH